MHKFICLLIFVLFSILFGRSRYIERFNNNPNDIVLSNFDGGNGKEWILYAGDSLVDDIEFVKNGSKSLRVYAHAGDSIKSVKLQKEFQTPQDFSNWDYLKLTVHISDSVMYGSINGDLIYILMGENSSWNNYFAFKAPVGKNALNKGDGWYEFTVTKVDFLFNCVGAPSWNNIRFIRIMVECRKNTTINLTFDQLKFCVNPMTKGYLMLTDDDGKSSVFDFAQPVFNRFGLRMTCFISGNKINTIGFMDTASLDSLYKIGYEIGSHSYNHYRMTTLDPKAVDTECLRNIQFLKGRGYKTWPLFAYPHGDRNKQTDSVVSKYHDFNRNVGGLYLKGINGLPYSHYIPSPAYSYRFLMPGAIWDTGASYNFTTCIKPLIDSAISKKICVGLLFHGFGTNQDYEQIDTATLATILSYAKSKVDAGLLEVGGMGHYLLYAPDSCIILKKNIIDGLNYTASCSLSIDADSMKMFLYESRNGTSWNVLDSTAMIPGGSQFSLSGKLEENGYQYKIIGHANSGTIDSTFPTQILSQTIINVLQKKQNIFVSYVKIYQTGNKSNFQMELRKPTLFSIDIVDMSGRLISRLPTKFSDCKIITMSTFLPHGIYIYRVKVNDNLFSIKVCHI